MTRPRAADDFTTIRARLEELRQAPVPAHTSSTVTPNAASRRLPPAIRQRLFPSAGGQWRIW
jgi:hypothetical protein